MQEQSIIHSTFVIERSYPKAPEQVFSAFADVTKKRRWFAPGVTHEVEHFEMDFRAGGGELLKYLMKEGTPIAGMVVTNEGRYLDIIPNRRIVNVHTMSVGDKRITASLVTVELLPDGDGTSLILTHQGAYFEGADGPQIREAGWRHLLDNLGLELAR